MLISSAPTPTYSKALLQGSATCNPQGLRAAGIHPPFTWESGVKKVWPISSTYYQREKKTRADFHLKVTASCKLLQTLVARISQINFWFHGVLTKVSMSNLIKNHNDAVQKCVELTRKYPIQIYKSFLPLIYIKIYLHTLSLLHTISILYTHCFYLFFAASRCTDKITPLHATNYFIHWSHSYVSIGIPLC